MEIINWNLSGIFLHTVDVSFQASVIILLIMIIKRVMGNRLSAGWHYGLWLLLHELRHLKHHDILTGIIEHKSESQYPPLNQRFRRGLLRKKLKGE
jgi:beta-lactamase regulating signal transducer with metallopeptidase domain